MLLWNVEAPLLLMQFTILHNFNFRPPLTAVTCPSASDDVPADMIADAALLPDPVSVLACPMLPDEACPLR